MFKNRTVQMKMVKDQPTTESDNTTDFVTAVYTTEIAVNRTIETVVKSALTVVAAKTASEIALHIMKTYVK